MNVLKWRFPPQSMRIKQKVVLRRWCPRTLTLPVASPSEAAAGSCLKHMRKKKVIQSAVINGSIQIPYRIIHSQIWSICNLLKGLFHLLDLSTLLTGCLSVSLNTSMFFTVAVGRSIQISIALIPTLVLVSDWYWHSRIGTLLLTSSKFSM